MKPGLKTEPVKRKCKSRVSPSASSARQKVSIDVAPFIPTSFSYGEMGGSERNVVDLDKDEENITSSVTISSLLSKLDSVKVCLFIL